MRFYGPQCVFPSGPWGGAHGPPLFSGPARDSFSEQSSAAVVHLPPRLELVFSSCCSLTSAHDPPAPHEQREHAEGDEKVTQGARLHCGPRHTFSGSWS